MRPFEPGLHAAADLITHAIRPLRGGGSFEELDQVLQALLLAAAAVQLEILELAPTELDLSRLTTAAYGQMAQVSASLLEEQAHFRALQCRDRGRDRDRFDWSTLETEGEGP